MASRAHSHNCCPHLMFFRWKKSLRWQTKRVQNVGAGPEGSEEMILLVFEIEDQAIIYPKSCEVYHREPLRKDLFYAFVAVNGHPFLENKYNIRQVAADGRQQRERRDSFSAPGLGKCDEHQSMNAERGGAVPG